MVLGVDDATFLVVALTTSAVAWAKRADIVKDNVYCLTRLCTGDEDRAQEVSRRAAASCRPPPSFLLRGFDLHQPLPGTASATTPDEAPLVPHRFVNMEHRLRSPHKPLSTMTSLEFSRYLQKAKPSDFSKMFHWVEEEGLWESALRLTSGLKKLADSPIKLNAELERPHMESCLRTLIKSDKAVLAARYCVTYCHDVANLDQQLLAKILDNAPSNCSEAVNLVSMIEPRKHTWIPELYSAALTAMSRSNWVRCLQLFSHLHRTTPPSQQFPIRHVFHVVLPLACDKYPMIAPQVFQSMAQREASVAPEVLLRSLHTPVGMSMSAELLQPSSVGDSAKLPWEIAFQLFQLQSNARNANSLLHILPKDKVDETIVSIVQSVPKLSDNDTDCLARTASSSGSWIAASNLAALLIAKRRHQALPILARTLFHQSRWHQAMKAMTVSHGCTVRPLAAVADTSLRQVNRGTLKSDFELCVHCALHCGKWNSALFWMERAHAEGHVFSPSLYDATLFAGGQCSWDSSLRALTSMRNAGGHCSDKGISAVVSTASQNNKMQQTLQVLWCTDSVEWVP